MHLLHLKWLEIDLYFNLIITQTNLSNQNKEKSHKTHQKYMQKFIITKFNRMWTYV